MSQILIDALRKCEAQFREYARQHTAKGTTEATEKALTNLRFAQMCRTAEAQHQSEAVRARECKHGHGALIHNGACEACGQQVLTLERG